MAGTINPQDSANNIISVLSGSMTAKLSALNTSYDDGITLDNVDSYWRAPQENYPNKVNIVVAPISSEVVNSPEQRQLHQISIEVIVTGSQSSSTYSGTELVTIRLWRTCRAVQECINKSTLSNNVDQCYINNLDASEIGVDGSRFEQRAEINLTVYTS
ncbi:MAG: hypothetical protein CMC15_14670 [Flavobacteriaceae bacterium]|nr:hypothetical protein [Flavobacteriaceae bacterium]|tara:strand:- start:1074 stop:1550 length:477 start_codon:yes stop_codon:yes gene_type:complete